MAGKQTREGQETEPARTEDPVEGVAIEETETALVVADPMDQHEVARVLDAHDEQAIMQAVQGRLSQALMYDFPQDGKRLVDLSGAGVRECVREMNRTEKCRIRVVKESLAVEEVVEDAGDGLEPFFEATVWAVDDVTGAEFVGTALQPKRLKLKEQTAKRKRARGQAIPEDNRIFDQFAKQKAQQKAIRNALKQHVPEQLRQALIAQYRGDDVALKRIEVGAEAATLAALPAPVEGAEADRLRGEIEAVYMDLHALNPTRLVPGRYHDWRRQADQSVEKLEAMLAHVRRELGEEQARAGR